jgi:hypothetical protein
VTRSGGSPAERSTVGPRTLPAGRPGSRSMVAAQASLEPRCNAQLDRLPGQSNVTLGGLQGCRSAVLRSE